MLISDLVFPPEAYRIEVDDYLLISELIPVKGNKLTLKSIFRNLLNNAIKYGGAGCCIVINLEMQGSKCRLNDTSHWTWLE